MFNTKEIKEAKNFTGLTSCKVLAINPTGKWLFDNGFRKEEKEVDYNYSFNDDNIGKKIQVYVQSLENEFVKGSVDFLIPSEPSVSQSGKNCYIDAFGKSSYADSPEDCKYLDQSTIIHSSNGLADFIKFIRTWARTEFDTPVNLNLSKLTALDFSELSTLVETANKVTKETGFQFGIKLLFGINDKGYAVVYNKAFVRIDSNKLTNLKKALDDDYSGFKANYQNSLEFKEYVEGLNTTKKEKITADVEEADEPEF